MGNVHRKYEKKSKQKCKIFEKIEAKFCSVLLFLALPLVQFSQQNRSKILPCFFFHFSGSPAYGFRQNFAQPQQMFALSLIILTAKLSKADGYVSREELVAVKQKLKIPEHEIDQVGKIFNKAKEDSLGYEPYAQQIAQIYRNNPAVLDEVINTLFYIAESDSNVSDSEIAMIRDIAKIFGLSKSQFEGIKESRKSSDKLNPYVVLGCNPNDDFSDIRKKYLILQF